MRGGARWRPGTGIAGRLITLAGRPRPIPGLQSQALLANQRVDLAEPLRQPSGGRYSTKTLQGTARTLHFWTPTDMTTIRVKENEPFDVALRRFKRTIEKIGLLTELRAREFYEKPTAERKRKKAAAVKRHFKRVRSMQLPK